MAINHNIHIHHKPIRVLNSKYVNLRSDSGRLSDDDEVITKHSAANLVRKLRNSNHQIVLWAVEELRTLGCLSDGTLSWICLRYANLQEADLCAADLNNVDLHKANLEMADLSHANLNGARLTRARMQSSNLEKATLDGASLVRANMQGANVSYEQLATAGRMRGSVLPDGNLYDGRFNLRGDFVDASILHVDLNNPRAIAAFFGVSLEDFLLGQEWRREQMSSTSVWHKDVCFQNAEVKMNWL